MSSKLLMQMISGHSRTVHRKIVSNQVKYSLVDLNGCHLFLPYEEKIANLVLDHSAYGNHGLVYGTGEVVGKIGDCFNFDGIDDFINVATLGTITGTFTVMAWVKPTYDASEREMSITGSRYSNECSFDFKFNPGVIHGDIGYGDDWITTSADAEFEWEVGTWYHIAYVVTPTYYKIFANGVLLNTEFYGDTYTPILADLDHELVIGNAGDMDFEEWWQGSIDEFYVYDRALTDTEIFNYYERTK